MGWELIVYTQIEVPLDDLLDELLERSIIVVWKSMLSSEKLQTTGWTAGYLILEGDGEPQITMSRETLNTELRKEEIDANACFLTSSQISLLSEATTKYSLTLEPSTALMQQPVLIAVAYILAESGNGLIYDSGEKYFYDPKDFGNLYFDSLPGNTAREN